jgi:DNA polymerase-3 subunit gamma/tau
MLGAVDRRDLERLLEALLAGDGRALIAVADDMLGANAPFERTLLDFAALLQRIALAQVGALPEDDDDAPARWAPRVGPEDLQVWYQIAIHGARDLPLAPDPHAGFTMALLRLLAFRPETIEPARPAPRPRGAPAPDAAAAAARRDASSAADARAAALAAVGAARGPGASRDAPLARDASASALRAAVPGPLGEPPPVPAALAAAPPLAFDGDWPGLAAAVVARLGRPGLVGQFMQQSELLAHDADGFTVRVPVRPLAEPALLAKVRDVLAAQFGRPVRLVAEVGAVRGTTVAAVRSREQADALAQAQAVIEGDAFVQTLISGFGGTIVPESIQPIGPTGTTGD